MSFGTTRTAAGACPCGTGAAFATCCAPVLAGSPAPTALALMRSRYTAFVRGDNAHLERTWHPRTRPVRVELDPATTWTGLRIEEVVDGGAEDQAGVVEFCATWSGARERGTLHERSRFVRRGGRWMYLDGEVS
jgi:SEC-C motif domain protein